MPLSNPIINFTIESALTREPNEEQRILVFGQLTTGTATPGVVVEVGNNEEDTLFGADSMVATAVRAIRRASNVAGITELTRVDALPLSDGTGSVAATGNVTFTGSATEAGTVFVTIGSKLNNLYEVTIASGETATAVGNTLAGLIAADTTSVITAVNTTGDVALTAINKGVVGNTIGIWVWGSVAGITVATTAMTGGTGEPDSITNKTAYNAISSEERYQGFVYPQSYDVATNYSGLAAFLDGRFPANNRILDGQAFITNTDTLANLKTLAGNVDNKNISLIGNKPVSQTLYKGSAIFELDYVASSYFAAIRALRLTTGAQIGPYVVAATGSLDDTGGTALASLPYMNTPFADLLPVSEVKYFWTNTEVSELLDGGISVLGNNTANNRVIAGQMVTTYLKDAVGNSDVTFKYLNYYDTFSNIREYSFNNLKELLAQVRLVEGDLTPLRSEVNAQRIKNILLRIYQDLERLVLVERGNNARKFFKNNLTVTIDKTTGTADVTMLVSPVVQLRVLNIVMRITFNIDI